MVVTVSVPWSVRSVSVEPLIFVTVPVAPPQNAPATVGKKKPFLSVSRLNVLAQPKRR